MVFDRTRIQYSGFFKLCNVPRQYTKLKLIIVKVNWCHLTAICDVGQETFLILGFPDGPACGLRHTRPTSKLGATK